MSTYQRGSNGVADCSRHQGEQRTAIATRYVVIVVATGVAQRFWASAAAAHSVEMDGRIVERPVRITVCADGTDMTESAPIFAEDAGRSS